MDNSNIEVNKFEKLESKILINNQKLESKETSSLNDKQIKALEVENEYLKNIIETNKTLDKEKEEYVDSLKDDFNVVVVSRRNKDYVYNYNGLKNVKDDDAKNNWKAWLYLAPVLVLMAVFLIYPLIDTFFISFMKDYNYVLRTYNGFTFDNYGFILGLTEINGGYEHRVIDYAIPNTLIICFITVPVSIIIALLISVGLNSLKWFQKILQTIFFLPYVTNTIAVGMVFAVIFDRNGVINWIFGLDKDWIKGAARWDAMLPLCIYIVWSSLPFKILVFLSGLQGIDKQYYQAAQIDATPKYKVLTRITVPLLSPQILYIMITSFIGGFKEYSSIVGMFNNPGTADGDYSLYTVVYYVYDRMKDNKVHYAAAAAVLLFLLILLFTALQFAVSKRRVHY